MLLAAQAAEKGIDEQQGGPFGATIVKHDEVIVSVGNTVLDNTDPTGHAELVAVREACHKLGTLDLSECVVYATCEPCPMCVGAMMLAGIKTVYYSSTKEDAANNGFSDQAIRDYLSGESSTAIHIEQVPQREECEALWSRYALKKNE